MKPARRVPALLTAVLIIGAILPAHAADRVIKVGTLKLIHGITPYFYEKFTPAGYKIEAVPFESPTDGKNAVLKGTVDFGVFGTAASALGAMVETHRQAADFVRSNEAANINMAVQRLGQTQASVERAVPNVECI
jgi:hypothetical protein